MKYVFNGPMPDVDPGGEIVHPGDVREFGAEPDCPPWELVGEPEKAAETPGDSPSVSPLAVPLVTPKGM